MDVVELPDGLVQKAKSFIGKSVSDFLKTCGLHSYVLLIGKAEASDALILTEAHFFLPLSIVQSSPSALC